jgi:response regulator RpfG family c-di-GMP phosphodiesterase
MSTTNNIADISFLVVDDEESVVISLRTLISRTFPQSEILTASDGLEAWNIIKSKHPSIVISDLMMPNISGMDLCKRIRANEELNDIYFMVISAVSDKTQRLQALENGVDDYITKPFSPDDLLAKLRSSSRYVQLQHRLMVENKLLLELADILEHDIKDMTQLSIKFLQARIPASTELLTKVANESVWIAKQFEQIENDQLQDIEIAAHLCYAGRIFLPDELIKTPVTINGQATNKIMYQVPVSGRDIVSSVKRFKDVGELIFHLYENFDGSGFPGRLQSWQIPLGARIIRVALDYEEFKLYNNKKSRDAFEMLYRESKRLYDHRIVTLLEQYIASTKQGDSSTNERAVQLHELEEGMVLSRDIITNAGLKLMPSGAVLREHSISKLLSHNSSDPILGNIFIKL